MTQIFIGVSSPLAIKKVTTRATSNAVGTDGIPIRFIKPAIHSIAPILEYLFNFSLTNGVFPARWKSALICPIPKVKNPSTVQHYRPISILPVLSKALERVVCDQIRGFLENSALLDPCQSAYRDNHSTQTCLLRMLDEMRHPADQRMVTVSVFFDFSKAFDRVHHHTLLKKLKKLRFSDSLLRWFHSYLTGRSQVVRDGVAGTVSSSSPIMMRVPQSGLHLDTVQLDTLQMDTKFCTRFN
ncbi:rna-directed dna polymerase from mobile element jockey-like protein [Lasius niger]|uniref:Rna-directed dna polymerase from mobile element jockey-like protein n=1 Tax=Lasius niger TaxID=67767 RepID=A0A0J7KEB3_LASNI|nr:rna-directed dna polymerase from mobile element jockey-like protein [Lasius niger]KMQ88642.1 rna-directed dna polymerase from mobile element jockey-like protein [Lasius niger]